MIYNKIYNIEIGIIIIYFIIMMQHIIIILFYNNYKLLLYRWFLYYQYSLHKFKNIKDNVNFKELKLKYDIIIFYNTYINL